MSKKNIEEVLRENLKRDYPKELDSSFYAFTRNLKSNQRSSRQIIWKSAFAFSFVTALFVYTIQYEAPELDRVAEIDILENVELLANMDVANEVNELTEDEFELLMSDEELEDKTDEG
ncbi:MAG: hypothetical protein BM556_00640 [Bacteriovorax sp. MedPE-SWde]|nr:MAG: hypothetical protein BM556_00640 [Bacteriovorax sp. MedPE-SWde]